MEKIISNNNFIHAKTIDYYTNFIQNSHHYEHSFDYSKVNFGTLSENMFLYGPTDKVVVGRVYGFDDEASNVVYYCATVIIMSLKN